MRNIFIITILLSPFSSPSWSETLTLEDLVLRNNLYYNKFTGVPFTGEIFGLENGRFKNGELEGFWKYYYKDGQLKSKGNYKEGIREVPMEYYDEDGKLLFKNDTNDEK